jgi:hypothetical protein
VWLVQDQQPIYKKGGGCAIHVSDFISETIRWIRLTLEQISDQKQLHPEHHLTVFKAQKIIYPGKGSDNWWNLKQLIEQIKITIPIFKITHPNRIGIFVFDRSSAHEGFAEDALNINHMNIKPCGKQRKLQNTVIPLSNLDPAPGEEDTHGKVQYMCYPNDHDDPTLQGKPKGVQEVLMERKSIWDKYTDMCKRRGVNVVGTCAVCRKSNLCKGAERHVRLAEEMEGNPSAEDIKLFEGQAAITKDEWCCMCQVLSLQDNFRTEKPELQLILEKAGHICLFLP